MDGRLLPSETAPPGGPVLVIGAGLVGLSCAWLLTRRGHRVLLVDAGPATRDPPRPEDPPERGSEAALGVLMGRVFHRSSGRGWRLRQRSLDLWQAWRAELAERGRPVPWRPGLLLLAADAEEMQRHRVLLEDPERLAAGLQRWDPQRLQALAPPVPAAAVAGLYSPQDGQVDPLAVMEALESDALSAGMVRCRSRVEVLERHGEQWQVRLCSGERWRAPWLVLAAGLGSPSLLAGAAWPSPVPLEPVLGQALELELDPADRPESAGWPGAVVWRGINLILRPPLVGEEADGPWRVWMGATLEPGRQADSEALEALRGLAGEAPPWLLRARIRRRWQGLRARPAGEAAPLLRELAPGLLLAAGHYRNGVLLAPVSAEWVVSRIEGCSGPA
ncbi:MAG: NAD(P)/FAD-dependent oxidoreductase [Cyanobium sp.]